MSLHRSFIPLAVALSLICAACGSTPESLASVEASSSNASTEVVSEERVSEGAVAVDVDDAESVEDPTGDPDVGVSDETTTTTTTSSTTTTTEAAPSCDAPTNALRWIDVAIDDPDGGLNLRDGAGVSYTVISVLPRSSEVTSTGGCTPVGSVDWWEVKNSDGATGWVSNRYLSDAPVFNPGLGKAIADTDNVGITAETLEELAQKLASEYGFDDDVVVTMVGEPEFADAVGGEYTFDLTGLKDDASDGYRVNIGFFFTKTDDANEITGFEAKRISNQALCSRGVTEDGRCI